MYFRYFVRYHLPLIKGWGLHLNWIPFTHGCFVLSLVEIGPVVLEIRDFFFLFHQCIFASLLSSSLGKGLGGVLRLNKLESPSPKDSLCQAWLKLSLCHWSRRWKRVKLTDRRGTSDQKSSLELSAQVG